MKSNIDLTENNMFSRPSNLLVFDYPDEYKHIKLQPSKYWMEDKEESADPTLQCILTGDRKQRHEKVEYLNMIHHKQCTRCGCDINEIPWLQAISEDENLCSQCDKELEKELNIDHKLPWTQ